MDRVHVDYAEPIQGSMILVLINAYSRWIEAHVVSSSISEVTIDHLSQIFATHGMPKSIVLYILYTNSSLPPSLHLFVRERERELCRSSRMV